MTELATANNAWLDLLIAKVKDIIAEWTKDTFKRYREVGKIIVASGYEKGRWNSQHRQYFLEKLEISQQYFSYMVRLGTMNDSEFTDAIGKFSSFYTWTHQGSIMKEAERQKELVTLQQTIGQLVTPENTYDVVVIDPPWPMEGDYDPEYFRGTPPYPTMSIEDIKSLKIPSADNCIIWLWSTNKFLHEAYHVLEAWGLVPKSVLTWVKDSIGVGVWLRGQTEHCILAVKGKPLIDLHGQSTALFAPKTGHSRKPDAFYSLVDSLCPGQKLNYFAREKREGWASYGTLEHT